MIKVTSDMWLKGWDERNGGNVSLRLTTEDVAPYLEQLPQGRLVQLTEAIPEVAGQYYIVTGTGKFFRNVQLNPVETLGLLQITPDGAAARIMWGFSDGGGPTSELSSHLRSHWVRQKASDGVDRAVIHCHPTNLVASSYVLKLDAANVTRALWEMSTECLVVFPGGIGVLPWLVPGTDEIGKATAVLMARHTIVLDEAFGLIDVAEKAADILVKVLSMGGKRQSITAHNLHDLAVRFSVKPMAEAIELTDWA
jgi:rhamnulose-1-phosphate aldolase